MANSVYKISEGGYRHKVGEISGFGNAIYAKSKYETSGGAVYHDQVGKLEGISIYVKTTGAEGFRDPFIKKVGEIRGNSIYVRSNGEGFPVYNKKVGEVRGNSIYVTGPHPGHSRKVGEVEGKADTRLIGSAGLLLVLKDLMVGEYERYEVEQRARDLVNMMSHATVETILEAVESDPLMSDIVHKMSREELYKIAKRVYEEYYVPLVQAILEEERRRRDERDKLF